VIWVQTVVVFTVEMRATSGSEFVESISLHVSVAPVLLANSGQHDCFMALTTIVTPAS